MSEYTKKYPNVSEFLSFFGQDWKIMFEWEDISPNFESAIRKLKIDNSTSIRQKIIDELKKILSSNYDETKLREIIREDFHSAFYPPGINLTYREWLEYILEIFEEPASETKRHFLPKFVGEF